MKLTSLVVINPDLETQLHARCTAEDERPEKVINLLASTIMSIYSGA